MVKTRVAANQRSWKTGPKNGVQKLCNDSAWGHNMFLGKDVWFTPRLISKVSKGYWTTSFYLARFIWELTCGAAPRCPGEAGGCPWSFLPARFLRWGAGVPWGFHPGGTPLQPECPLPLQRDCLRSPWTPRTQSSSGAGPTCSTPTSNTKREEPTLLRSLTMEPHHLSFHHQRR